VATPDELGAIDIRVGRVLSAETLAGARVPALALRIDFGPDIGERQSSARITELYSPAALCGGQVLALLTLPPRRTAGLRPGRHRAAAGAGPYAI